MRTRCVSEKYTTYIWYVYIGICIIYLTLNWIRNIQYYHIHIHHYTCVSSSDERVYLPTPCRPPLSSLSPLVKMYFTQYSYEFTHILRLKIDLISPHLSFFCFLKNFVGDAHRRSTLAGWLPALHMPNTHTQTQHTYMHIPQFEHEQNRTMPTFNSSADHCHLLSESPPQQNATHTKYAKFLQLSTIKVVEIIAYAHTFQRRKPTIIII